MEERLNLINAENQQNVVVGYDKKEEGNVWIFCFVYCVYKKCHYLRLVVHKEWFQGMSCIQNWRGLSNEKVYLDKSDGLRSEPLKHFYGSDGR